MLVTYLVPYIFFLFLLETGIKLKKKKNLIIYMIPRYIEQSLSLRVDYHFFLSFMCVLSEKNLGSKVHN